LLIEENAQESRTFGSIDETDAIEIHLLISRLNFLKPLEKFLEKISKIGKIH
jgi:hypothetical protein